MKPTWLIPIAGVILASQPQTAIAHGVEMEYRTTQALEIQANYDTGEPMKNAQVTVYPPKSDNPWLKGQTDDKGRFTFTPDPSQPGNWEVKVRLAGHGDVITVPVGATQTAAIGRGSTGYSPLQRGVMAASVIWGLAGTALFFWRRK